MNFANTMFLAIAGCFFTANLKANETYATEGPPNIVVMMADDMGFGEVQCLNPARGKIATPHLDNLAKTGLVFADAHSGSSVCTPTRYGLMTGRYAWRTRLQKGVLTGGSSLIAAERMTIAKMLKRKGYDTAIVGKWHLGMLYNGKDFGKKDAGKIPAGASVTQGPVERGGFDFFRGFHHSRQMDLWIEDAIVTQNLTPIEMLPKLTETAVEFVRQREGKTKPFFLYVPWNSPHSPVEPSKPWQGKSGLNAHADFVMQTDDAFGQVIRALKETGQFENTLIICTCDNGTSGPSSKMRELNEKGHFPSGDLRGSKADIWDGGHRVPFIVSWPNVIKSGRRTDALVCLTDLIATLADITETKLSDTAGEDSFSFLGVLKGTSDSVRENVIHHSSQGYFAIRSKQWKLICCPGSGGWTAPRTDKKKTMESALARKVFSQLYDMTADLGETNNLAESMPAKEKELRALLDQQVLEGRSTPGVRQANDAEIEVDKWKSYLKTPGENAR